MLDSQKRDGPLWAVHIKKRKKEEKKSFTHQQKLLCNLTLTAKQNKTSIPLLHPRVSASEFAIIQSIMRLVIRSKVDIEPPPMQRRLQGMTATRVVRPFTTAVSGPVIILQNSITIYRPNLT
jgi:hypothetical protein